MNLQAFGIVFLGAGCGGALRHGVNQWVTKGLRAELPFATLTVNILGSLLMGFLVGFFAFRSEIPQHWKLFLTTGFLGGFTTFSAFALDYSVLIERGDIGLAYGYALGTVVLSLAAVFAGLFLSRSLFR